MQISKLKIIISIALTILGLGLMILAAVVDELVDYYSNSSVGFVLLILGLVCFVILGIIWGLGIFIGY